MEERYISEIINKLPHYLQTIARKLSKQGYSKVYVITNKHNKIVAIKPIEPSFKYLYNIQNIQIYDFPNPLYYEIYDYKTRILLAKIPQKKYYYTTPVFVNPLPLIHYYFRYPYMYRITKISYEQFKSLFQFSRSFHTVDEYIQIAKELRKEVMRWMWEKNI